jgi:hypothetical protein
VDPRAAAKIGLTGAIIGAVLLLVRMSPVKPNDEIITYDLTPAKTMLVQNIAERSDAVRTATGERSDAVVRTATQPSRSVHRSNFARMIRAKRSQHGAAHVRIIDAPTRIKQSCGEQTWPYIADYCLAVAKDDVSPAAASPIAANPSTASARRDAAGGVDPSSTQAIHVGDAAGSHSTGNGLAETNSYQTAALLDDAPATIENEKSEPARRASEPRHYERRYARSRQASTEDERPVRVRHASVRRHYEARRHYAWSRQAIQVRNSFLSAIVICLWHLSRHLSWRESTMLLFTRFALKHQLAVLRDHNVTLLESWVLLDRNGRQPRFACAAGATWHHTRAVRERVGQRAIGFSVSVGRIFQFAVGTKDRGRGVRAGRGTEGVRLVGRRPWQQEVAAVAKPHANGRTR